MKKSRNHKMFYKLFSYLKQYDENFQFLKKECMENYSAKWENDKNKISEINNNPSKVPRSVTCNSNNNVIVTLTNNKLETDSNFQPQVGLKSGNSMAVIGRIFLDEPMVGGFLNPYWQISGKFLRPFYWKTHPSKNHEYLFSFF